MSNLPDREKQLVDEVGSNTSVPQEQLNRGANGVTEPYAQTVSPPGPPSKADVEARLRSTSDSISARLEAIQNEFATTGSAIKSAVVDNPIVSVALAMVAGYLVGKMFRGRGGDDRASGDSMLGPVANLIATEAEEALARGESPEEAVQRVLESVAPSIGPKANEAPRPSSKMGWIAGMALRSLFSFGMREIASRFAPDGSEPVSGEATPSDL